MSPTGGRTRDDGVIDAAAVLDRVAGNLALLRRVVGIFMQECPELLSDIRDAIARGDRTALLEASHALKGSAGLLGGARVSAVAERLESMAGTGSLTAAPEICAALEAELERFKPALGALV
jgi:HPt (histidine-containing phosphotransfer) domain-containing protein